MFSDVRARLLPWMALPGLLLAGACDLPLDTPVWETRWTLLGAVDTVVTGELLPDGVVVDEGGGFRVEPLSASRSVILGDVCPVCTCFSGPVPRIDLEPQDFNVPLPGRLSRAALRRGRASLVLHNEIPFDLLDDGLGNTGFLTIRLMDRFRGTTLDSLAVTGSLPPGDSTEVAFDLEGLELDRNLVARVGGVIPGSQCDSITLEPEDGIRAEVSLDDVEASDVTILVADQSLALPSRSLELPDAVDERLRPGEARILIRVQVESTVALGMEILISVATKADQLFGPEAALTTPILVPPGEGPDSEPVRVEKLFNLDLARIQGADSVYIDTRNQVDGSRRVLIRGGEAVRYTATLHADLPSR